MQIQGSLDTAQRIIQLSEDSRKSDFQSSQVVYLYHCYGSSKGWVFLCLPQIPPYKCEEKS